MAELILTFEWDGKTVKKETSGFSGESCVEKTKFIERALGNGKKRQFKEEYYEKEREDKLHD